MIGQRGIGGEPEIVSGLAGCPGEFSFQLLAEGIVPDNPVPHKKSEFIGYDFDIRGETIAYSDMERAGRFENLFAYAHPLPCPGDIFIAGDLVVILVVFVADIERRVGKNKISERLSNFAENFDAVTTYYPVEQLRHIYVIRPE
jgi:hypothetical protein